MVNDDGSVTNVLKMQGKFRRKNISGRRRCRKLKDLSLYAILSHGFLV